MMRLFPGARKGSLAGAGAGVGSNASLSSRSSEVMTPSSSSDVDSLSSAGIAPRRKSVRFSAGVRVPGEDGE